MGSVGWTQRDEKALLRTAGPDLLRQIFDVIRWRAPLRGHDADPRVIAQAAVVDQVPHTSGRAPPRRLSARARRVARLYASFKAMAVRLC